MSLNLKLPSDASSTLNEIRLMLRVKSSENSNADKKLSYYFDYSKEITSAVHYYASLFFKKIKLACCEELANMHKTQK